MEAAIDPTMMATDLADYLVEKEIPFREAHWITGQVVRLGLKMDKALDELRLSDFHSIYPGFDGTVYEVFDPRYSVSRRKPMAGLDLRLSGSRLRPAEKPLLDWRDV